MPVGISQDSGISQGWSGVGKPVIVVPDGSDTEGHYPLGDLQCRGLTSADGGQLVCGFEGYPNCTQQVAACNVRREQRG